MTIGDLDYCERSPKSTRPHVQPSRHHEEHDSEMSDSKRIKQIGFSLIVAVLARTGLYLQSSGQETHS